MVRKVTWTRGNKLDFIKRCEKVYKKSTSEIIQELEENDFEGSPEIRRWYKYAKELGVQ